MKSSLHLIPTLLTALLHVHGANTPVDWPEWRGPDAQGHAIANGVPDTWTETQNIAWRCDLPGRGWSGMSSTSCPTPAAC